MQRRSDMPNQRRVDFRGWTHHATRLATQRCRALGLSGDAHRYIPIGDYAILGGVLWAIGALNALVLRYVSSKYRDRAYPHPWEKKSAPLLRLSVP